MACYIWFTHEELTKRLHFTTITTQKQGFQVICNMVLSASKHDSRLSHTLATFHQKTHRKTWVWHNLSCAHASITWTTSKWFSEDYFMDRISATTKKCKPQKQRVVYSKWERKVSSYWCPDLEASLCLDGCFKNYNINLKFYQIPSATHPYRKKK